MPPAKRIPTRGRFHASSSLSRPSSPVAENHQQKANSPTSSQRLHNRVDLRA
ncbi:hypothetical protein EJ06DRAFT_532851 [Trichodelitschia bisporula]|uniref:Uncharacterized protein n=1 Tax=Trichodelitschia bisporula TaxID=703511 RepID=A0A6G1HPQ8_9PEZI|nr:hypothetical protein EJ06DRAFT_532851 [Trichodelitschia bisporula]